MGTLKNVFWNNPLEIFGTLLAFMTLVAPMFILVGVFVPFWQFLIDYKLQVFFLSVVLILFQKWLGYKNLIWFTFGGLILVTIVGKILGL